MATYLLWELRTSEVAKQIPTEKELFSRLASSGTIFSYETVTFMTPWSTVDTARGESTLVVKFEQGDHSIVIFKEPSLRTELMGDDPQLQKFWGDNLKTDYDIYKTLSFVTTKDINLWLPASSLLPQVILLTLKSSVVPTAPFGAYSFTNKNGIRGFEYRTSATSTIATFFTPKDERFTLIVAGATSDETDVILQSLSSSGVVAKDPPDVPKIYLNEEYDFQFSYPATWSLVTASTDANRRGLFGIKESYSASSFPRAIEVFVKSFPITIPHGIDENPKTYMNFDELVADAEYQASLVRNIGGFRSFISDGHSGECSPYMWVDTGTQEYIEFQALGINYCYEDYLSIFETLKKI